MGQHVQSWSPTVRVPSTLMHAVAIIVTIFRLLYRWRSSRFWWEDAWAALTLMCDILCLTSVWMQTPPVHYTTPRIDLTANWILSLATTCVIWFARMSILCSIVRIANPTPLLRRIAYCIGILFLAMQSGLLAQKIFMCVKFRCHFTNVVAITQLVTDVISDAILVAASVRFLRDLKLPLNRRILILSAFSASILITILTICHSALLFRAATNTTIIIGHAKAALALLVCNALVLVMFVYRLCHRSHVDLEHSITQGCSRAVEFTSFIEVFSKFSSPTHPLSSDPQTREDAAPSNTLSAETAVESQMMLQHSKPV